MPNKSTRISSGGKNNQNTGRSKSVPMSNWQIIRGQIKYIDLLIEVCDARAPKSSRHPRVKEIFGEKLTLLILNKADLADSKILKEAVTELSQSPNEKAIALSLKSQQHKQTILKLVKELTAPKRDALKNKGISTPTTRICIVGMPNVGKSSLINWLGGHRRAKVGNKPGITKGPQWIKIDLGLELLDTPGVLPRDNLDSKTRNKLALINLLSPSSDEIETLAHEALGFMKTNYPIAIKEYLGVTKEEDINLEVLAKKRNFLSSGGKYNLNRAAHTLLGDLSEGKLGGVFFDNI